MTANTYRAMDIRLCLDMGNAFLETGKECNKKDREAQAFGILFRSDAFWSFPAIVNTAFACELYFKALLAKHSSEPLLKSHSLAELFHRLPADMRSRLKSDYKNRSIYNVALEDVLMMHSKSFETWRYTYEEGKGRIEAYPDQLILVAEVLQSQLQIEEGMV